MKIKFFHILSLIAVLLLSGCRADEPWEKPDTGETDGKTYLNILIPSAQMARATGRATRAEINHTHGTANLIEDEATIKRLYLVAFYEDKDGNKQHFFRELPEELGKPVDGIYMSYKLEVAPNNYELYVVGNVKFGNSILDRLQDSDLGNDDNEALKSDLEKLHLSKSYNTGTDPEGNDANLLFTTENGLPMSWHSVTSVQAGSSKSVVANMEFACAKVRLTVLYDATEGGISESAYGRGTALNIGTLDATNIYLGPRIFSTQALPNDEDKNTQGNHLVGKLTGVASGEYYELPADLIKLLAGQLEGKQLSTDGQKAVDAVRDGAIVTDHTKYAWQSVCYLPENKNATAETTTRLLLNATKGAAEDAVEFQFTPGCDGNIYSTNDTPQPLKRGNYYDIVAKVNKAGNIDFFWKVIDWTPINETIELSGNTELTLGTDVIPEIDAQTAYKLPYQTNAPYLTLESSKTTNAKGKEVALFLLTLNKDDGTIDIRVNGEIGLSQKDEAEEIAGSGFWVTAGNIKKWVRVEKVKHGAFLNLIPTDQTVYASQVADETNYHIIFQYSTNLENLKFNLPTFDNDNAKQGRGSNDAVSEADENFYWEVCVMPEGAQDESELVAITKPVPFKSGVLYKDYVLSERATEYEKLPKTGYIRVTMKDPSDPEYFSKTIKGTFEAVADIVDTDGETVLSSMSDSGTFNIIARAMVYTIHFKPLPKWDNPHIYVYQELEYNGYPVYDKHSDNNKKLNWLEYNLTGKVSFKGWKMNGGIVDNLSGSPTNVKVKGYPSGRDIYIATTWPETADAEKFSTAQYDLETCLLPDSHFRKLREQNTTSNHCECRDETPSWARLWPGVAMIEEEDGWFKIELPLIAKPGKARVMFADNHGGDNNKRYPADRDPGIILPDYADCEAWFLLDKEHEYKNCDFSNTRRDSYSGQPAEEIIEYALQGPAFNGWSNNSTKFTGPTDGKYTWTGDVKNDGNEAGQFIITKLINGEQKEVWQGAGTTLVEISSDGTYTATTSGNRQNWKFNFSGNVTLTFDPEAKTLTVKKGGTTDPEPTEEYDYYLDGAAFGGWFENTTPNSDYKLSPDGKGNYVWKGKPSSQAQFGISRYIKGKTSKNDRIWISSAGTTHDITSAGGSFSTENGSTNWNIKFTDKEATFTFTPSGADGGGTLKVTVDGGSVSSGDEYYLVAWPTSWGGNRIYLYKDSTKPFGDWNTEGNQEKWKANIGSTEYYFKWGKCSDFGNIAWTTSAGWGCCIIGDNNNKKDNYAIDSNHADVLNTSDIPDGVKTAVGGTIKAALKLK